MTNWLCYYCGHPTHFHITQFKQEGARKYPTGENKCMIADCPCIRHHYYGYR